MGRAEGKANRPVVAATDGRDCGHTGDPWRTPQNYQETVWAAFREAEWLPKVSVSQ